MNEIFEPSQKMLIRLYYMHLCFHEQKDKYLNIELLMMFLKCS